jgi:hypothetical protein
MECSDSSRAERLREFRLRDSRPATVRGYCVLASLELGENMIKRPPPERERLVARQ